MSLKTSAHTTAYQQTVLRSRAALLSAQHTVETALGMHYHLTRTKVMWHLQGLVSAYDRELARVRAETPIAEGAQHELMATVPLSWLTSRRGGNWPRVAAAVTSEVRVFGRTAYGLTTQAKQQAVSIGSQGAQHALIAAVQPIAHLLPHEGHIFVMPNDAAVRAFVARAKDGGPLARLFDSFGPEEAAALRETIAAGLAAGTGPLQLARELQDVLDKSAWGRAATICRTETIHAWNDAALVNYRANSDVVESWMWMADKGGVTCAGCCAMDGQIFSLDEELDDHANGRCAKGPVTKGYDEILRDFGIDASSDEFGPPPWASYQSGEDWLDEQDSATQRSVFGGDAAYLAWLAGDASLSDFAGIRRDREWGDSIYQQSLRGMGLDASDYSE